MGETLSNPDVNSMRRIQSNLLHLKARASRAVLSHPGIPAAATLLQDIEQCLVQLAPTRLPNPASRQQATGGVVNRSSISPTVPDFRLVPPNLTLTPTRHSFGSSQSTQAAGNAPPQINYRRHVPPPPYISVNPPTIGVPNFR